MDYLATVLQALDLKYVSTDLLGSQDSAALWRVVGDVILLCHNAFHIYPGQRVPCGLIPLTAAALRYPRARIFDDYSPSDSSHIAPNELLLFLCFLCDECGILDHYRVHHCSVPTPPYPPTLALMPPSTTGSSDSSSPSGPPSSDRCLQWYTKWRRAADHCRCLEKEEHLWEQRWESHVPALSPYEAFVITHSSAFNAHRKAMSADTDEVRLWEWAATLLPSVNMADTTASHRDTANRTVKGKRAASMHDIPVGKDVATLNIGGDVPRWAVAVHEQSAHVQHLWTTSRAMLDAEGKLRVRKACAPQARRLEGALCPARGAAGVSPDALAEYLRDEQADPDAWREKWSALLRTCAPLHITRKPPFLQKGKDKDAHIENVD
eukprot:GEMP01003042.1.p1 GENE.GEMP01003042.1~~GEMP01003042.1.p1  ORF type:complete len:379 (+),score=86.56 GEMP01003042.1:141-1277(+)